MTLPGASPAANHDRSRTKDPVPALISQLGASDRSARLAAVLDLERLGPLAVDALHELQGVLHDDQPRLRKAAARALGHMGLPALDALAGALDHRDKEVRRQAVWAISHLGPQALPALSALCNALKDLDARTASGAAQAIANMGPQAEPAIPALIAALQNVNLVQCRLVAKALSEIGPVALPALIQRLSYPDYFVRREVAVAIGFMGMRAADAVEPILNRLTRLVPPPFVPAHEMETVVELSQTPATPVKPINAEPCDDRIVLIETLARIGPAASAAREYLISTLNDPDRRVAEAAAQALLRIMGWN